MKPATLALMEDRLDGLLSTRLRNLILPPDIAASFWTANAKTARKMAVGWCRTVGFLSIPSALFDLGIVPAWLLPTVLTFRAIISLMFLLAAFYLHRRQRHEGWCVILPCCAVLAMAGISGDLNHSGEMFAIYMTMSIVVVCTAVILVPLRIEHSAWLTGLSCLIIAGAVCISPLRSVVEKLQMWLFYVTVLAALLDARSVQNRYQYRLFLLQARDELRSGRIARRNEQLSSIAYVDRLTNIPNRRYFDEFVESINLAPEPHLPLAVCLIDVDHFKNLNDRLGHLQGDRCLAAVASAIRDTLRADTDILARFGGEEFVLLLPRTAMPQAAEVAERVRQAVLRLHHSNPGSDHGYVTVSAGIAVMTAPERVEQSLQAADQALYRAKQSGRNRVCR